MGKSSNTPMPWRLRSALASGILFTCFACSGTDESEQGSLQLALQLGPSELVIDGILYKRSDQLSESELKDMADPELWEAPETLDKVAQLLRTWTVDPKFGEYVEAEPNYYLAQVALGFEESDFPAVQDPPNPKPVDESGAIEKTISSDGDQRSITGAAHTGSNAAQALRESGASGTIIPGARIYTAGHVLYNNSIAVGSDGWVCRDGTADASATPCLTPGFGSWRFGGRITNPGPSEVQSWASSWVNCGSIAVPNAWKNMPFTTDLPTISASDYGRANISTCVPQGVQTVGSYAGITQADLRVRSLKDAGYPERHTCPVGSFGGSTDCPTMGSQGVIQIRPTNNARPHTGGNLASSFILPDATLTVDSVPTGTSIGVQQIDATRGQSGSALMHFESPTAIYYVVGALSTNNSTTTRYNHLTVAIRDWVLQ